MSALDLSTYILASFTTVQEVKKALDPAHFTVVNFQLSQAAIDVLLASGLMAAGGYPTIHLGIHDAMHNSLVIEFTGMPEHLQPLSAPDPKHSMPRLIPCPWTISILALSSSLCACLQKRAMSCAITLSACSQMSLSWSSNTHSCRGTQSPATP